MYLLARQEGCKLADQIAIGWGSEHNNNMDAHVNAVKPGLGLTDI